MKKDILLLKNSKLSRYPGLVPLLEKILCVASLNQLLNQLPDTKDMAKIIASVLHFLDIKLDYRQEDVARIPAKGPVIIVSNHPFGGIEGAALADILLRVRPDVKILANYILKYSDDLSPLFIGVDPLDANNRSPITIRGLQEAQQWLEQQGLLVILPAGTVSHWQWKHWQVTDPNWQQSCVRLAEKNNAVVVPLYFHGRNSWYFQLAGAISPFLRTLLLPQQLMARRHHTLSLAIGKPILPDTLKAQGNNRQKMDYLRRETYMLAYHALHPQAAEMNASRQTPIAKAMSHELLTADLQAAECLVEQGEYAVYIASGKNIPHLLHEIGRLREMTFRAVGEGTGSDIDLDAFDQYYQHLFVWHKDEKKIIGAYRLGLTDKVLPELGAKGLYVSTLYQLGDEFFARIQPAIEMGRTFIVPEFQKKPQPLLMLWKGIGKFLVTHPHYIHLYGVVSVSGVYQPLSRDLIVYFLNQHYKNGELARCIQPKSPYPLSRQIPAILKNQIQTSADLDTLEALVSEIEADHKGLPVLIRRYLGIGCQFLGFNQDKEFNDCLDCLNIVAVKNIPPKQLVHYLGKEGMQAYLLHHGVSLTDSPDDKK